MDQLPEYRKLGKDREWVYFISAVGTGLVKIGSSKSVKVRLRMLQYGCPVPLIPMLILNCRRGAEFVFHKVFEGRREHGEWFRPDDQMLDFIASEHPQFVDYQYLIELAKRLGSSVDVLGLMNKPLTFREIHDADWERELADLGADAAY